jgi:hypothetical protein
MYFIPLPLFHSMFIEPLRNENRKGDTEAYDAEGTFLPVPAKSLAGKLTIIFAGLKLFGSV